jgi:hypothetical protein
MEALLIRVRAYLKNYPSNHYGLNSVTAEALAKRFEVDKHYIVQCFSKLNKEGLISKGYNRGDPHREYWRRTVYNIRKDEDSEES